MMKVYMVATSSHEPLGAHNMHNTMVMYDAWLVRSTPTVIEDVLGPHGGRLQLYRVHDWA